MKLYTTDKFHHMLRALHELSLFEATLLRTMIDAMIKIETEHTGS